MCIRDRHAALLLLAEDALCGISGLVDQAVSLVGRDVLDFLGDLIDHAGRLLSVLRGPVGILKKRS